MTSKKQVSFALGLIHPADVYWTTALCRGAAKCMRYKEDLACFLISGADHQVEDTQKQAASLGSISEFWKSPCLGDCQHLEGTDREQFSPFPECPARDYEGWESSYLRCTQILPLLFHWFQWLFPYVSNIPDNYNPWNVDYVLLTLYTIFHWVLSTPRHGYYYYLHFMEFRTEAL